MRKNILSRHQSHCEQLIFREYLFRITSSLQTLVMVNVTRLLTDSDLHGHIEYVGKYANSKIKWSDVQYLGAHLAGPHHPNPIPACPV